METVDQGPFGCLPDTVGCQAVRGSIRIGLGCDQGGTYSQTGTARLELSLTVECPSDSVPLPAN